MNKVNLPPTPPICQPQFLDPIPRILPHRSLCYMAGASGTGKTVIMADWLARMRDGRPICGHLTNKPTGFYYLAADRDWSTYAEAFAAAGFPDINRYVLAEDPTFHARDWKRTEAFKFLERCLNYLNPIPGSIVIVDPIAPLFVQGMGNDAWDVAISSHFYREQCRVREITMVAMANVAKQRADNQYTRPQDRIAGSGAFVAYSDTQVYLSRDEEGVLTLGWVPRRHKAEEFTFEFDAKTELFVPCDSRRSSAREDELTAREQQVLGLIPPYPETMVVKELKNKIRAELKLHDSQVHDYVKRLVRKGVLVQSDLGVLSRPPTH